MARYGGVRPGTNTKRGGLLSYPLGVGLNAEYPHSIEFTARKRNLSSSNQNASTSLGSVVLYLPADALKTSYSQTFGDADLGAIGAATASIDETAAAGVVNQIDRTLRNVGAGRTDSAIANLTGALAEFKRGAGGVSVGNALAQATVNEALNRPGVGPLKDALFRKAGRIINPHKAVIYQGPGGFRIFNYSFVMSPESQAEAETIAKIVHYFKYYMHPGIPSSDPSKANINSSVTLSYPEEFKITARVKNVSDAGTTGEPLSARVKPLFKIDHCFLESLSVDYSTSGGPVFIVDGITAPATTSLTLQFKETVLMTKEKIREGY